ncbi:BRISC and BRCA1-A complex member 2-like [Tripterygium wilfordii]|uniref:BRISC and BRCA1-A complex member 2-like n=1 Tax=Tripterygium wilfordii TaxID=458696 RepID=UPI0018F85BCB|nr:BRISC and BRCA1-A complex member 2-like [Tripterygium wilfordii]
MSIDGFPPFIAAQLHYLLNQCTHSIKVDQVWSGSKYPPGLYDRFTLLIPYCLDFIRWDVIYNVEFPLAAPDVIFGPEDEDFHPLSATSGGRGGDLKPFQKSLQDWNYKDPTLLLALIQELRDHYVSYQRKRVGEVDDDRLKFEISTIVSREGIEMHMSSGVEKPEEVKFAVPLLDKNINKMVLGCPWRHQQKMYLQVIYPVSRKYMTAPSAPRLKLMSTPELKALFSVDDVKLPSWVEGMCMAEYLPHLEETLERQVLEAVSLIDVRRRFIETLAPLFGRPVEADSVFCRKATFLAASGAFIFLVHFLVSTQFPKQQPSMILQSTQHFNNHGMPVKSTLLADYPWSPRWEASQMAERIFEFLADESLNFKRYCNESQLQH